MNQQSNMPKLNSSPLGRSRERALLNIIVITAIFAAIVSILMLLNYLQLSKNDPIESHTLSALVERLKDDPNNDQLKDEIRAFDLMARKAFFTAQWQVKTAGWLLLIGAVVLMISLRYYFSLTAKIEEPETDPISQQANRIISSKWLLGTGGVLILLALIASVLSTHQLSTYLPESNFADAGNDAIELIDLTSNNQAIIPPVIDSTPKSEVKEQVPEPTTATVDTFIPMPKPKAEIENPKKPIAKLTIFPTLEQINQQANSFRGPMGHGIFNIKNAPTKWNVTSGENILWKVKIPTSGQSSPVIWDKQLFVTGATAQERWVYCYNTNNGKIIWQQQANNIPGSPTTAPKTTDDTGLAAPSVVTNGISVVAIFGTGDIIAFDMKGNRIWAKNIGVPDNHYGHSSSLLAWKEKVVVQYDTNKGGRLLALNIQTGEIIWDTKRNSHISWASPILIDVNGKMQIVTSAEPTVGAYDLETGKELWKVDCLMGEVGPSPAFGNGLVVATNEYATLAAIDPLKGTIVWEGNEYLPEVASPVVADGLLIIATTYSVIACYDIHTGNKYWEAEYNEGFYSSPVVADGKIYATDMNGVVHLLKLDRQLSKIADLSIGEKVTTTPVFTNERMYIRGSDNLYCIGK